MPACAVSPRNPDFVALAEAFGARGTRPAGPDEFVQVVTEALAAPMPTVVEVRQDAGWLG
jgi:acetolactate synthase-1/2/3 large subunit